MYSFSIQKAVTAFAWFPRRNANNVVSRDLIDQEMEANRGVQENHAGSHAED
jgi:hypothetical protein